jgi:hypothetical protein
MQNSKNFKFRCGSGFSEENNVDPCGSGSAPLVKTEKSLHKKITLKVIPL